MEIKNFYKTINAYVNGTNRVSKIKNEKVRFYKYRNLRLEKLADKYAYLIYKNFENQIIKFDKKLQKFCE
jgi:outer membrane protein assembly factor BamD (BamD/ComL family)